MSLYHDILGSGRLTSLGSDGNDCGISGFNPCYIISIYRLLFHFWWSSCCLTGFLGCILFVTHAAVSDHVALCQDLPIDPLQRTQQLSVFYFRNCSMPQPKNPHPHHQYYSKDLRACIIHQRFTLHKWTTDIATDLDMSLHVVQQTIKLWCEIGDVMDEPKKVLQALIVSPTQVKVC